MKLLLTTFVMILFPEVRAQLAQRAWLPQFPPPELPPTGPNCALVLCAIPNCPESQRTTFPGECCPRCLPGSACANLLCAFPNCLITLTPPGQCCPICVNPPRTCSHRGEIFQDGETFTYECNTCRCYRGRASCTRRICPDPQPTCEQDGIFYQEGESVPTSSPCEHCMCRNSNVICIIQSCAAPWCEPQFQTFPDGQCCPVCTDLPIPEPVPLQ